MDEQPLYKFKWTNVDLDGYIDGLKAKAQILRRDALLLTTRAEQIEDLARNLDGDLIAHEPEEPK